MDALRVRGEWERTKAGSGHSKEDLIGFAIHDVADARVDQVDQAWH